MSDNLLTLPEDLKILILAKLSYFDIARLRGVCKAFDRSFGDVLTFRSTTIHLEDSLSPFLFFWQDGGLEWRGFNHAMQQWMRLPSLRSLLPPRSEPQTTLLKDYLVATSNGLLCMDISESRTTERIIICNPLSQTMAELPPLNHRRRPVVMNVFANSQAGTYQVLVAGSAAAGNDCLSKKTEVYDSAAGEWEVKGDIPGAPYGVNLFQSGVLLNGFLFCLGVDETHLVLAYDVKQAVWVDSWRCPFPDQFYDQLGNAGTNQQLVGCGDGGEVVLFWEKVRSSAADQSSFCFAALKWQVDGGDEVGDHPMWGDVSVYPRKGGAALDFLSRVCLQPLERGWSPSRCVQHRAILCREV